MLSLFNAKTAKHSCIRLISNIHYRSSTLTMMSPSRVGPMTPRQGFNSSSGGGPLWLTSVTLNLFRTIPTNATTSCRAMNLPGQYVDPPPKGL